MRILAPGLFGTLLWVASATSPTTAPVVVRIDIDSVIHPISVEILRHAVDLARKEDATAVVLRLDTPGGLLTATQEMIKVIQESPVPVITLVAPSGARAASAGFFLLLSGDVAVMLEGTRTGAASPILLGKEMDPVLRKKVESDTAALIRSISARKGRNAKAAEEAVLEARAFTAQEALQEGLIDQVVSDEESLWRQLDGREITRASGKRVVLRTTGARQLEYTPTWRERAVSAIADPNLSLPLLLIGGLLLYFEFTTPGAIAPGVAGAILVLLGLTALSALPVNAGGVALLVLALLLFVLEIKITSHGVLGGGGVVAMILGALLLVEGPPEMRIRPLTAVSIALPFAAITLWLLGLVVRARRQPPAMRDAALLNETAVAVTGLDPKGTVLVRGEYWTAESKSPVASGQRVRITAVNGLILSVEPVD